MDNFSFKQAHDDKLIPDDTKISNIISLQAYCPDTGLFLTNSDKENHLAAGSIFGSTKFCRKCCLLLPPSFEALWPQSCVSTEHPAATLTRDILKTNKLFQTTKDFCYAGRKDMK